MKSLITILFLCTTSYLFGQNKTVSDYGFRHLQTIFKGDTVDILIKSKKGEEQKKKPLFLFCQGSLPIPLIIQYDENGKQGIYNVFVFNTDSLSKDYHLVIINKPYVPLIVDQKTLNRDLTYVNAKGQYPPGYIKRNILDYYVDRNIAVIKYLQAQNWISTSKLVVAGHSEGSTIAAKMALRFPKVTHLVYSGGNPAGRILTMIGRQRVAETDSARFAENIFMNWKNVIADPTAMDASNGDTNKTTFDFSIPPSQYLEKLNIPVFISYGTKDAASPFNDQFRVEMMRRKKTNFTFNAYTGTEHNYFPVKPDGQTDFSVFNWDKVADDWRTWLRK